MKGPYKLYNTNEVRQALFRFLFFNFASIDLNLRPTDSALFLMGFGCSEDCIHISQKRKGKNLFSPFVAIENRSSFVGFLS